MYIYGLPIYNNRVTKNNVNINDVITLKINGKRCYRYIVDITDTMIKVKCLDIIVDNQKICFIVNDNIDTITNNYLSFDREIYKVSNVIYC